eukprot:TRINITY_DN2205_c0_g1_i2.p2 TRINITY_DN2205_c0_g1~~TRINITY_DN2205_c0_g1_i2.p2  ORF type:complete len:316 (+),score=91.67 TRINITY_DN2205_c0_g1_i2:63-950(+)
MGAEQSARFGGAAAGFPFGAEADPFMFTRGLPQQQQQPRRRQVIATGLVRSAELNGQRGTVVGRQGDRIQVDFGAATGVKALRPANLLTADVGLCSSCGFTVPLAVHSGRLHCGQCGSANVQPIPGNDPRSGLEERPAGPFVPFSGFPDMRNMFAGGMPGMFGHAMPGGVHANWDEFTNGMPDMFGGQFAMPSGVHANGNFAMPGGAHANWADFMQGGGNPPPPPASAEAVRGLKRWTAGDSDMEVECVVCQDGLRKGDEAVEMPCGHTFHNDCLMPWLKEHNTCPTCRHELPTQ